MTDINRVWESLQSGPIDACQLGEVIGAGLTIDAGNAPLDAADHAQDAHALEMFEPRLLLSASPVGNDFRLNQNTGGPQEYAAIAVMDDGRFVAVWEDNDDGSNIFMRRFAADGTPLGGDQRITGSGSPSDPDVAINNNGVITLVWVANTVEQGQAPQVHQDIYMRRFDIAGNALDASAMIVNDEPDVPISFGDAVTVIVDQYNPAVAMGDNDGVVIVWEETGFQLSTVVDGVASASATNLDFLNIDTADTQGGFSPDVAMTGQGDVVAVFSAERINGQQQVINSIEGVQFDVNSPSSAPAIQTAISAPSSTTALFDLPRVAIDADGDFAVTWQTQGSAGPPTIEAQRYNGNGNRVGGAIFVEDGTNDVFAESPAIGMDDDGNFVVGWSQITGTEGGVEQAAYRQFNSDGSAVDATAQIANTTTVGNHREVDIAMTGAGDFVMAWDGDGPGDGQGIFARRFADQATPGIEIDQFNIPSQLDEGETGQFSVDFTYGGSGTITIEWDMGDGTILFGQSVSYAYADNGNYNVSVVISDDDEQDAEQVGADGNVVVDNVDPSISNLSTPDTLNVNELGTFNVTFTDPGSADTHVVAWNFGDGGPIEVGNNVQHLYTAPGTYNGTVFVEDDDGGVTSQGFTVVVSINTVVITDTTLPEGNLDEGEQFNFTAAAENSSGGTDTFTFEWDFGDSSSPVNGASVNHAYPDNGSFNGTLTVTNSSGQETTAQFTVNVDNVDPSITNLDTPATLLVNQLGAFNVTFTDPGTADTHVVSWNFGDGGPLEVGNNVQHQYTAPGTYNGEVFVEDDDGGVTSQTFTVVVGAPQVVIIDTDVPTNLDEGEEGNFTAEAENEDGPSNNLTFEWDFGDGTSPVTGDDVDHTYADDGNYTVTLTVTNAFGEQTQQQFNVVVDNVAPSIDSFQAPSFATVNELLTTFQATASDPGDDTITFSWDFGDGSSPALGQNAAHTYTQAGTFTITLTVSDEDGGVTQRSQQIDVEALNPELIINDIIEPTGMIFEGSRRTWDVSFQLINGQNTNLTFEWNFGDGTSPVFGQTVRHRYADDGFYDVTVTITDDEGEIDESAETTIEVKNVAPTIQNFNVPSMAETGQTFNVSALATDPGIDDNLTYSWNFGDGSGTKNGINQSHSYAAEGMYTITLTVRDGDGGEATRSATIDVQDDEIPITLDITGVNGPSTLNEGQAGNFSVSFNYVGPGAPVATWTFSDGDGPLTGNSVSKAFADDGSFVATVTIEDGLGNLATQSINVDVNNVDPTITSMNVPAEAFVNTLVNMTSTSSDPGDDTLTHTWDFGDGSPTVTGLDVSHTFDMPAPYTVTLTVTDEDGGETTQTQVIIINRLPDVDGAGDTIVDAFNIGPLQGREIVGDELTLNDEDLYRFEITDNKTDTTLLLTDLDGNADLILMKVKRNGKGKIIAESHQPGSTDEFIAIRLNKGTYIAKVVPVDEARIEHTLIITTDVAGDTARAAHCLGNLKKNIVERRGFAGDTDGRDLYCVKIKKSTFENFYARVEPLEGSKPTVRLLDKNGLIMRFSTEVDGGFNLVHALKPGKYLLEVLHNQGPSGDPGAAGGNYDLTVFSDKDKAGLSFENALGVRKLKNGKTVSNLNSIGGLNAGDMHRLKLKQSGTLVARVFDLTDDLKLTLFDDAGNIIGSSNNPGTEIEQVTVDVTAGTYYAFVEAAAENISSPYMLQSSLIRTASTSS